MTEGFVLVNVQKPCKHRDRFPVFVQFTGLLTICRQFTLHTRKEAWVIALLHVCRPRAHIILLEGNLLLVFFTP